MRARLQALGTRVQSLFRLLVLIAIVRIASGLVLGIGFQRDALAWGYELTLVVAAAAVVYLATGLIVRRASQ